MDKLENVALDTSKQKEFVKSIKGIKKLIQKSGSESKSDNILKVKDGKIHKKIRKERGLVYLSHIPHGFYEHEMTQYFKQFGVVTNARVIRSKRTGNSKGFAFVEFREPSVAQIVAETMNNYLMGKRLIKAGYIPPEKQKAKAFRKNWSATNNPGHNLRMKMKKAYNADKDEKGELNTARKLLSNLTRTKKKLSEMGIDYDFFTPVDIPETLLNRTVKQENGDGKDSVQENVKQSTKSKKNKLASDAVKEKVIEVTQKKSNQFNKKGKDNKTNKDEQIDIKLKVKAQKQKRKGIEKKGLGPIANIVAVKEDASKSEDVSNKYDSDETVQNKENVKKSKKKSKKNMKVALEEINDKVIEVKLKKSNEINKKTKDGKANKGDQTELTGKVQQQKRKDLKKKGVECLEDFIAIKEDGSESDDSTYEFDSDEYEKMIQNEDESELSFEDDEESDKSDDVDSEEEPPVKKNKKGKTIQIVPPKKKVVATQKNQAKKPALVPQVAMTTVSKKRKFEKQKKQKSNNKQFKKK